MNRSESTCASSILGVALGPGTEYRSEEIATLLQRWFQHMDCRDWVDVSPREDGEAGWRIRLKKSLFGRWTPGWDTVGLAERLAVDFADIEDRLELEIVVSMLASPIPFEFPNLEEWESTVRVRSNIVRAASKTFLSFDAYGAERPEGYWEYDETRGFVVCPGKSILDAFRLATQPGEDGPVYSFSCYRATEYVIALGLAEEIQRCNDELFSKFQLQCERRAIRSGEFHEVFMKEYGSHQEPLPPTYYVPGDRVWFKNPDPDSADALGFEGSWVFYLGDGRFTDFWKRNQAFTLELKCLEMYHWRHSTYRDSEGILRMDEKKVQACMRASEQSASELDTIYRQMARVQDRRGVYADGGCIDPSREYPRWVRPGTTDIVLPDAI